MHYGFFVFFALLFLGAFFFYASYSIRAGIYLKSVCRLNGRTEEMKIALTFDDGPHPSYTPKVLDILQKYGVQATFFCIGSEVERYPKLVRRIVEEGHSIGIHAYEHRPAFPLFSKDRMSVDLLKCQLVIERACSIHTDLFRPPFGVTNPTIAYVVKALGLVSVGWSLRSYDTQVKNASQVIERIKGNLRPNDIVLLHDRLPFTADVLDELLRWLRDEGYQIVLSINKK